MTRVFNVYTKDGTKVLSGVKSPAVVTGLSGGITHVKGSLQVTAIDDDKPESEKVDVPEFTTQAPPIEPEGPTE